MLQIPNLGYKRKGSASAKYSTEILLILKYLKKYYDSLRKNFPKSFTILLHVNYLNNTCLPILTCGIKKSM